MSEPRRFTFETVFDGDGEVVVQAPARKTFFTAQEMEQVRADSFAAGQRAALNDAQRAEAAALAEIKNAIGFAMGALAQAAHDHRTGAAELALGAAKVIAGAALERFPQAAAEAALEALAREVQGHPRLMVRTSAGTVEAMQGALDKVAEQTGFSGQVSVRADPHLQPAAFIFEWGEGKAAFDPEQAAARVAEALTAALAAEGLHAEPLIPN